MIPQKDRNIELDVPFGKRYKLVDIAVPLGIALITLFCFSPILKNHFLFWDDNQYILNNIHIRRFTWENIKYLFSHQFAANWQPLTMLSYALNYYFSGYSPTGYFATNLALHLANTVLVFFITRNLISLLQLQVVNNERSSIFRSAYEKQFYSLSVSAMVSLWFGIHPMHVESVGWLFERKDVLYAFFYLAAMLIYTSGKTKLFAVWALFVCSCLSKPMAVVFPVSLILIDYLCGRLRESAERRKAWIEKLPFLFLSVVVGVLTLHTQNNEHAFIYPISFLSRIQVASYTFLEYIYKLAIPLHLSGFYPYPMAPGEALPSYFHIYPVLLLLLVAAPMFLIYKRNRECFRILAFGLGFYLVNIALVLQFLSVGSAIISDRYSYIAYYGLFFILGWCAFKFFQISGSAVKILILIAVVSLTIFWAYLGNRRTLAWNDTETMLTDVIKQYPKRVPQAYKYLGIYYGENGRNSEALACYTTLVDSMRVNDADAYCNLGSVFMAMQNLHEAIKYLEISLQMDSNLFMSYRNLGIISADTGNYGAALLYYQRAKRIYPLDEGLYNNISFAHAAMKEYDSALSDYNVLLGMNLDNALYWFNRGVAYYQIGNADAALTDFTKTLALPELKQNIQWHLPANAAFNLSIIYRQKGNTQQAAYYAAEAQRLKGD